ncbi:hypothetical protein G6F42_027692 [Rhizopus arrhizus]|nr:hypothetical protein G6F42_027692 [Rhizopus arrhizus]
MFSQKSQLIIISSLIAFVLVGISSALGPNEPMSARAPPISCGDLNVESNLVRQECLSVDGTDTLDCSFYFDAKKRSLLNDTSRSCLLVQAVYQRLYTKRYFLAFSTFMLDHRTNSTLVDNLKIGSFQVSSADFVDVGIILTKAINGCSGLVGFP